jgi:hypothetical protein
MPYASERSDFTVLTGYCWLGKREVVGDALAGVEPGLSIFLKNPSPDVS